MAQLPEHLARWADPLPSTTRAPAIETLFRDMRDPKAALAAGVRLPQARDARRLAAQAGHAPRRLQRMPPLITAGLRDCQIEAIDGLERSLAADHPRSLIQMATGAGKTFTACHFSYRLIKHAGAKRILFLVDRNNLGDQTLKEFQAFRPPGDGRNFTDTLHRPAPASRTGSTRTPRSCITTIQRLYSMLRGEETAIRRPRRSRPSRLARRRSGKSAPVAYNPAIPIETFDFIVTDECHRSIYGLWRQVLEYFDAYIIGLTATPSKHTLGFFNQQPRRRIPVRALGRRRGQRRLRGLPHRTEVTEQGSRVEAGYALRLARQAHAAQALRAAGRGPRVHRRRSSTARSPTPTRSAPCSRPTGTSSFTELFPGRDVGARRP